MHAEMMGGYVRMLNGAFALGISKVKEHFLNGLAMVSLVNASTIKAVPRHLVTLQTTMSKICNCRVKPMF